MNGKEYLVKNINRFGEEKTERFDYHAVAITQTRKRGTMYVCKEGSIYFKDDKYTVDPENIIRIIEKRKAPQK